MLYEYNIVNNKWKSLLREEIGGKDKPKITENSLFMSYNNLLFITSTFLGKDLLFI